MYRVRRGSIARIVVAVAMCAAATCAVASETPDLVLSRQLAEARGLAVGDVVTLAVDAGGAGARRFRIAGLYEPVPDPMKITHDRWGALLHLPDLHTMLEDPDDPHAFDAAGRVNVALADPADAAAFARDLRAKMPGLLAYPSVDPDDGDNPFVVLEQFHLAIAIVTVLGSTAFLLALMVMRADERKQNVSILRLIGVSRRSILLEVLFEGVLVAIPGAVFGVALAIATQGVINAWCQWRYDTTLVFVRITPEIAAQSIALAIPLGIVAGLVASWASLRRDVLGGMRR